MEHVWRVHFGDSLYHRWPADVRARVPMGRITAACGLREYPIRLGTAMARPRSRVCTGCSETEQGPAETSGLLHDLSVITDKRDLVDAMVRAIVDGDALTSQTVVDGLGDWRSGAHRLAPRSALGHQGPRGA